NRGTCDDVDYRVNNDGTGILGGWAWGENVGWISFSCENRDTCADVDYGVTIGPAGYFSGYGWGENIGWINFDLLTQPGFQVLTSWEADSGEEDDGGPDNGGGPYGGNPDATGTTNKKPVIDDIIAEQQQNYTVRFTVAAHDPDGTIVSYAWQFSETYSVSTPGASVSHSFDGPGTYAVDLTVKDNNGAETSDVISVEVTESVDDDTPPVPEEGPECTEDADCDDGGFCNGEEACLEDACVEGDVPCADNEVCMEDKQACWTEETVEAKSLVSTFRRPRLRGRRCVWLALNAPDAELFDPAASEITCAGPGGDDTGVAINQRRQMRLFKDYILVPLCIEKEAEAGAWLLQLETVSGTAREKITTTLAIK
ncbi:MAG: PKD domain-containing protein, partial [Deltaproteobacteria bacterium]|nr:PKD domain-containing protein [Deltaproteobacteria bacterium]